MADSSVREIPFTMPDGSEQTLADFAPVVLVVNVASKCGLTPQYGQLEELQREYGEQGFTVLGFPCNQFMGQEPGSNEEIAQFCSATYGVTFPLADKTKVNFRSAAPLYKALKQTKDASGKGGPVMWNFEKFLVDANGKVQRFRPSTAPDSPEIIAAIEEAVAA